jgi:hypothetical protein
MHHQLHYVKFAALHLFLPPHTTSQQRSMGVPRSQRIPNKEFTWKDSSDEEYVGANPNRAMAGRLGIAAFRILLRNTLTCTPTQACLPP